MDNEIIEVLNNILKTTYEFGWQVGASWDPNQHNKLVDLHGYLHADAKIESSLHENITKLLAKLGYNPENYNIYTKEDCSIHENDWDYIAPMLEQKEKD